MNFNRESFLLAVFSTLIGCVGLAQTAIAADSEPETLRVMTFNLWHGGDAGGQPLEQSAAVIEACKADVVGLQETAGNAPEGQPRPDNAAKLAKLLGWHYLDQGDRTGIISRFKIVSATDRKWGAKLATPTEREFYLFNVHFSASPYQPYQLLRIPYHDTPFLKTEEEAIQAARDARGNEAERMLSEVKEALAENVPLFIIGDFNEPCVLDWTQGVFAAKQCPLPVQWPATKAVIELGLSDAYRNVHPDPVKRPGYTWTPITKLSDPNDRHDRIDFVFGGGPIRVKSAQIVGESEEFADIVVRPYPSDHRAVCAEVEFVSDNEAQKR
jgi:endonuclease/exonuclease/phosphatase family metal-dependent hydrolase